MGFITAKSEHQEFNGSAILEGKFDINYQGYIRQLNIFINVGFFTAFKTVTKRSRLILFTQYVCTLYILIKFGFCN